MFRPVVTIIRFLSFDSLKTILYNSGGGVFDKEISTPKPLLENGTSTFLISLKSPYFCDVVLHYWATGAQCFETTVVSKCRAPNVQPFDAKSQKTGDFNCTTEEA
jgi:hypothetical protein